MSAALPTAPGTLPVGVMATTLPSGRIELCCLRHVVSVVVDHLDSDKAHTFFQAHTHQEDSP